MSNKPSSMQNLLSSSSILIVSDYDGTLAPITKNPDKAFPQPQAWENFLNLSSLPGIKIALLTGRSRSDILHLTDFPFPEQVVGGHGAEFPGMKIHLSTSEHELYQKIKETLDTLAKSADGTFVEEKPFSLVLHTRQCSSEIGEHLIQKATNLIEKLPDVHRILGKKIIEFSVRSCNKGDGLAWLIKETQSTSAIFLGDDTTDEFGFIWLRDHMPENSWSIKVGQGKTHANDRVETIDDIANFFHTFYRDRSA